MGAYWTLRRNEARFMDARLVEPWIPRSHEGTRGCRGRTSIRSTSDANDASETSGVYRRPTPKRTPIPSAFVHSGVGSKGVSCRLSQQRRLRHSVWNVGKSVSISLHTYGRHINYTGRSEFDLEHKREKPYVLKIAVDEHAQA